MNANDQNAIMEDIPNNEGLVGASISQKSDIVDNYTTNNSKQEKIESFEMQSDQMKKMDIKKQEDLAETEEDQIDQEFLDKFDDEATSKDLGNLYTSCLEWILDKPISTLDSQLMIDDYDKIQYPAAIELIINLVSQSNDLLR